MAQSRRLAERTRLLYVALTRAREALVLGLGVTQSSSGASPAPGRQTSLGRLRERPRLCRARVPSSTAASEPGRLRCVSLEPNNEHAGNGTTLDSAGSFFDGTVASADEVVAIRRDRPGAGTLRLLALRSRETLTLQHLPSPCGGRARVSLATRAPMRRCSGTSRRLLDAASLDDAGPVAGRGRPANARRARRHAGGRARGGRCRQGHGAGVGLPRARPSHSRGRAALPGARAHRGHQALLAPLQARRRQGSDEALLRWWGSDVPDRNSATRSCARRVPFFQRVDSAYGGYVEGAIDLLATDPGSDHACLVDYKTGDRGLRCAGAPRRRHEMQANFYAYVLMKLGFASASCRFVCVELDRADAPGQPWRWCRTSLTPATHPPRTGIAPPGGCGNQKNAREPLA